MAVSISGMGLSAPGGLACSSGGMHEVMVETLRRAVRDGRGTSRCVKCKEPVTLVYEGSESER